MPCGCLGGSFGNRVRRTQSLGPPYGELGHQGVVSTPEADYPGTTKGLFFVHFLALARRHLPEADVATMCRTVGMPARISRFGSYPIVPYTAFQELLAQRLYPQVELTEGMGLLGREAFLAFAGSVAGRVVTALVVRDVPHIAPSTISERFAPDTFLAPSSLSSSTDISNIRSTNMACSRQAATIRTGIFTPNSRFGHSSVVAQGES